MPQSVTILSDDTTVLNLVNERVLSRTAGGGVHLSCSTISVEVGNREIRPV